MAEALDKQNILRQNLLDAGCGPVTVQQCIELASGQKSAELLRILAVHRQKLLELLHQNEQQIDCLDYLIYQIEKQKI